MQPTVLVTRHIHKQAVDLLRKRVKVDYHDSPESLAPAELAARAASAQGLVCQLTDSIDAALFAAAPELRVAANVAVGYDNIDLKAARERGIVVTNTPDVLTETTADLAFALLMAAARRLGEAERFLRAKRWRRWEIDLLCGHDLFGATLGIVGFGRIGRAVARRAEGFNMRVLYTDPDPDPASASASALASASAGAPQAERVEFDRLLGEADLISLHVPLTAATHHLIGEHELARMKPTAILANTSRGPVVDEAALAQALKQERIAGAGLDVYEREPEIHPDLLALENVVLLPHIGSASVETRKRMSLLAAENCLAVLAGKTPPNPVA